MFQTPFGSSSFADLLNAPFPDDPLSVIPPEELNPFADVALHSQPSSPLPLPSFQETYSIRYQTPIKMDEECFNVSYHAPQHTSHHYEYQQLQYSSAASPYYPPPQTCAPSMYFYQLFQQQSKINQHHQLFGCWYSYIRYSDD